MMAGIGLLGSFTAFIASYFLGNQEAEDEAREQAEFRMLQSKIEGLERSIAALTALIENRKS
jgi:hypothetical protein